AKWCDHFVLTSFQTWSARSLPCSHHLLHSSNRSGCNKRGHVTPLLLQQMVVRHGNSGQHGPDDAEKSLIGAAQVQISDGCRPVQNLDGSTIDRPVDMPGETVNRLWREDVDVQNVA